MFFLIKINCILSIVVYLQKLNFELFNRMWVFCPMINKSYTFIWYRLSDIGQKILPKRIFFWKIHRLSWKFEFFIYTSDKTWNTMWEHVIYPSTSCRVLFPWTSILVTSPTFFIDLGSQLDARAVTIMDTKVLKSMVTPSIGSRVAKILCLTGKIVI